MQALNFIFSMHYFCKVSVYFDCSDSKYDKTTMPYCWKLEKIREYVHQETLPTTEEIGENLGTDISALGAVPTAIYSFLQSPKPLEGLQVL